MYKMDRKSTAGTLCALLSNTIFGFSFMFSKMALNVVHPILLLTVRFAVSFLLLNLFIVFKICRLDLKGKKIKDAVILGLCQPFLYMIFEIYGIKYTSSAVSGVIIALVPVVVLALSGIFLKEKPTLLQTVFALVSVVGIALISIFSNNGEKTYIWGIVLLFAAVLTAAFFNLISRKISSDFTAFERTYITFAFSFIGFSVISVLLFRGDLFTNLGQAFSSGEFVISLIYLSLFSSVLAFLSYNYAVSSITAIKASSFSNIITPISIFAGIIFLNEQIILQQAIGCALIIIGVYFVNRNGKKEN